MNTLSPVDVETAMNDLLAKNGHTTSMEVKEELRSKGFWATQAEVGPALQDIADQNGIPWTFNGRYRTYTPASTGSFDPNDPLAALNAAVATPTPAAAPKAPRTPPADPADREPLAGPEPGCWEAHDAKVPGSTLYFKGALTETQAKYAFTVKSSTNSSYTDVRVKRV